MAKLWVDVVAGFLVSLILCGVALGGVVPIVTTVEDLGDKITVIESDRDDSGFASVCRPIGDVNGDGRQDFAFFGQYVAGDAPMVGYVFLGRQSLPPRLELSRWYEWGIKFTGYATDRWPIPSAELGDLDGDGFGDMVFGVPGEPQEPCPAAGAFILFGSDSLPDTIPTSDFGGLRGCEVFPDHNLQGLCALYDFVAGDVNGDGLRDLIAGMPGNNRPDWNKKEGLVYVVLGSRPFPAAIDLGNIGADPQGCRITAYVDAIEPRFGWTLDCSWDFDGDGLNDIVASVPWWTYDPSGQSVWGGGVFVIFGRTEWPADLDVGLEKPEEARTCRIFSTTEGDRLGLCVLQGVEDVTGDGVPDLLISASISSGSVRGIYLVSGADIRPGDFLIDSIAKTCFVGDVMHRLTSVGVIPDRTGDGMKDLVFGSETASYSAIGEETPGAIFVVPGRVDYPSTCYILDPHAGLASVYGASHGARLGAEAFGCNVTGNGPSAIVAAAPGRRFATWEGYEPRGRLYVVPGDCDLLGALVGASVIPQASNLTGGGRMAVYGRGFDENTQVFVGTALAEIIERPDSCRIIARVPPAANAGAVTVVITRGAERVEIEEPFVYFATLFPYEFDIVDLEDKGCVITESSVGQPERRFIEGDRYCGGSGDFTGDQKADVLFAYQTKPGPFALVKPGRVFLVHGSAGLPREVGTADLAPWATIFISEREDGMFGPDAWLVGDMNGDGMSELAVSEPLAGKIYVLFGGPVPKGEVVIQDLIGEGRGFVIEDCPTVRCELTAGDCPNVSVVLTGDLNGDGLQDFGVLQWEEGIEYAGVPYLVSTVAFVLGAESFPSAVSYGSLPRLHGRIPPNNGVQSEVNNVRNVGDVDGDGYDDIAIETMCWSDPELPESGDFYAWDIFFGREAFAAETSINAELTTGGAVELFSATGTIWPRVDGVGDQNGDGKADLIISVATKHLLILYGRSRQALAVRRDFLKDSDFDVVFPVSPGFNDRVHVTHSSLVDMDEDSWPDLLVMDSHYLDAAPPSRAMCIFGGDLESKAAPLAAVEECYQIVNYNGDNLSPSYYVAFARSFHALGDVNGDGHEDLLAVNGYERLYICYNPLSWIKFGRAFIRGDANQDGALDIADAITILQYLFAQGRVLPCMDAGDANDDETVNIADAIRVLSFLFGSGVKPPLPPPSECGPDPQGDTLDCRDSLCE